MAKKPDGIVSELQRDCLDQQVSISTILRKAKVIASKLELTDLNQWITSELEGYTGPMSDLTSALDYVRNKTLDWTLELERRGIFGEGLTFGAAEKREAQAVTNHIYGG